MIVTSFHGVFRWLSNFHPCEIYDDVDDIKYPSVEAFYQAQKSDDIVIKRAMVDLLPFQCKMAGRTVKPVSDWNTKRLEVMERGISIKFSNANQELVKKLLDTGDMYLIEGNKWHDNFWGGCYCEGCYSRTKHNWLGEMLMKQRKILRG